MLEYSVSSCFTQVIFLDYFLKRPHLQVSHWPFQIHASLVDCRLAFPHLKSLGAGDGVGLFISTYSILVIWFDLRFNGYELKG